MGLGFTVHWNVWCVLGHGNVITNQMINWFVNWLWLVIIIIMETALHHKFTITEFST